MTGETSSPWERYEKLKETTLPNMREWSPELAVHIDALEAIVDSGREADAETISEQEKLLTLVDGKNNNVGIRYLFQINRQLRELRATVDAALQAQANADDGEVASVLMGDILRHQIQTHNVEPKPVLDGAELYLQTLESITGDPSMLAIVTNQRQINTAKAAGNIVAPTKEYNRKKVMHAVAPGGKNGYIHTVCGLYQGPKGKVFRYTYVDTQVTCPDCLAGKVVSAHV